MGQPWCVAQSRYVGLGTGASPTEHGGLPSGTHRAPIGLEQRLAAGKAVLTPALEDRRGGLGRAFHETDTLRFERIEGAGVQPGLARVAVVLGQPGGARAALEGDG